MWNGNMIFRSRWVNWLMAGIWAGGTVDMAILGYGLGVSGGGLALILGVIGAAFWAVIYAIAALEHVPAWEVVDRKLQQELREATLREAVATEDELHERAQRNVRFI